MGYIRDVAIGGETHLIEPILYGISSTAAATAAKTATINNFELVEGVAVKILFQHENSAATPTLNISNTGAKNIFMKGNWSANDIITFTYNGTNWVMENRGVEVITPGNGLINGTSGTSKTAITSSGTISIQSGGVTNEMLANPKITIANSEISLGDSVTLSELGICANNDARLSDARTPLSHTHGNITNEGNIAANSSVTIGNGDCLIITDNSNSNKIVTSSIAFDGTTNTKALTQAGTWETFNNYELPVASSSVLGGIKIGYTNNNKNYGIALSNEQNYAYVNVPWTDTKVTQNNTSASTWKKLLLSYQQYDNSNDEAVASLTNLINNAKDISAQPSTGTVRANIYRIKDNIELQWNTTDESLDFVFI